jgi:hypothetical protein
MWRNIALSFLGADAAIARRRAGAERAFSG